MNRVPGRSIRSTAIRSQEVRRLQVDGVAVAMRPFSPRWAKMIMLLQSAVSLITVALVVGPGAVTVCRPNERERLG